MRRRKTRRLIAELAILLAVVIAGLFCLGHMANARIRFTDSWALVPVVDMRPELLASDNTLYIRIKTVDRPSSEVRGSTGFYVDKYQARIDSLPRKPVRAVVRIDCTGGVTSSAIGAAYVLHDLNYPVTLLIDGACYSSAMYLLAYSQASHVYITAGGRLMLHNPAALSYSVRDEEKTAAHQEQLISGQVEALSKLTGQPEERIRAWKDAETYFTARQAVEYGFCDSIVDVTYR